MDLELRALDRDDRCKLLRLGEASLVPLKTFLAKEAKRLHDENLAKTFVLVEAGQTRVLAYATLLCTHVAVQQLSKPLTLQFRYQDYPAVKLARLAVDVSLQGQGAGGALVDFVVALAAEHIMPHAGCRLLVLDAKPNSVAFYEKKGFSKMGPVHDGQQTNTAMFIDLHKLGRYAAHESST